MKINVGDMIHDLRQEGRPLAVTPTIWATIVPASSAE
jgi:hypothetical protein